MPLPHLTRVRVNGVDLLGVLEFFTFLGALFATIVVFEDSPPAFRAIAIASSLAAVAAFDAWWRRRDPEPTRLARWFSPNCGECIFYVPTWLHFCGLVVAGAIHLAVKSSDDCAGPRDVGTMSVEVANKDGPGRTSPP